jgi:chaperonin GroEL
MKAGIIDPTKVVRTALQNAASVAGCCSRPRRWSRRSRRKRRRAAGGMPHGGEDF